MTFRPLRRTLLATATTAFALAALSGTVAPAASAERAVVYGPVVEDEVYTGPAAGQASLHSPRFSDALARKFK